MNFQGGFVSLQRESPPTLSTKNWTGPRSPMCLLRDGACKHITNYRGGFVSRKPPNVVNPTLSTKKLDGAAFPTCLLRDRACMLITNYQRGESHLAYALCL